MADPCRGEIWLVDLGTGHGHEQSGQRPVLIVSDDAFNAGLSGLVMVAPLTSKTAKSRNIPAHIPVLPPEGGLKAPVLSCAIRYAQSARTVWEGHHGASYRLQRWQKWKT